MTVSLVTSDSRLGRLLEFDDRSRSYAVSDLFTLYQEPVTKLWDCCVHLNQGQEGACVGFGFSHELNAAPDVVSGITDQSAHVLYKQAQTLDPWPGEDYQGTTVLAGVKALMQLYPDYIDSYRWAFGIDDLIHTLSFFSPVVLGIKWHQGMYPLSSEAIVKPTGATVGGHCILARGVDMENKMFTLRNSWGQMWGNNGDCFISFDDMQTLLLDEGEACVLIRKV